MKNSIFLLIGVFVFSACSSSKKDTQLDFDKPKIQIPKANPKPRKNKGSLYSMEGASLFADKKDLQIGDILQVNISESLSADSNNKRELTTNNTNSLGGGVFAPTTGVNLGNTTSGLVNKLNNGLGVGFNSNSSTSNKGEVKTAFDENFSAVISVIIEEIYENGNYYIKGSKELLIEGQKQKVIIAGVIRPYDISSENSVNSSQIANLKVLYDKRGEDAETLETPWGTKFLKAIWPF